MFSDQEKSLTSVEEVKSNFKKTYFDNKNNIKDKVTNSNNDDDNKNQAHEPEPEPEQTAATSAIYFNNINQYMLSNELYSKFDINYNNSHYSEENNTKNKISNKISNNMSLFWTFYLIIYDSYNSEKMFKIKNDYAIKFIEKIKK